MKCGSKPIHSKYLCKSKFNGRGEKVVIDSPRFLSYYTYEPRREKTVSCICENKEADQLRSNREANQRLCFRYMDSTIPLLSKSEISSLYASSVIAQPDLCQTWSETPKTGFLMTQLIQCRLLAMKMNIKFCIKVLLESVCTKNLL